MLVNESVLRRIVREEIERIERSKKRLIVQGEDAEEMDERSGYDLDRPTIPGGEGSHDPGLDLGRVYEEDDFEAIRLARFKASGMSDEKARQMAKSKLKHRGKHPGQG